MRTPSQFLDALKEKTGSDYKSAKALKITTAAISQIRSRELMSDETAIKVADALGIDRGEALLAAAMARSAGETKTAWETLSKRLSTAAIIAVAVTGGYSVTNNDNDKFLTVNNIHYAKFRWGGGLSGIS